MEVKKRPKPYHFKIKSKEYTFYAQSRELAREMAEIWARKHYGESTEVLPKIVTRYSGL